MLTRGRTWKAAGAAAVETRAPVSELPSGMRQLYGSRRALSLSPEIFRTLFRTDDDDALRSPPYYLQCEKEKGAPLVIGSSEVVGVVFFCARVVDFTYRMVTIAVGHILYTVVGHLFVV